LVSLEYPCPVSTPNEKNAIGVSILFKYSIGISIVVPVLEESTQTSKKFPPPIIIKSYSLN